MAYLVTCYFEFKKLQIPLNLNHHLIIHFLFRLSRLRLMITLNQLLNSSPEISQFFNKRSDTPQEAFKLASELLIESIRRRMELEKTQPLVSEISNQNQVKSPKAHYNVAYVKHNRFLSPSQKRQVTAKVTEVIPVSPEKVFIYGKPKVKLDEGYGCPLHEENCQEYADDEIELKQRYEKENQYPVDRSDLSPLNYTQELPRLYEEYLSPKNKFKKKVSKKEVNSNQTIGMIRSPKNNNSQQQNLNRVTSQRSLTNLGVQINESQNYQKVQSKIKELIQRDKRNRQLQKQVQKQRHQILEIEERQNRLLMMQKYQQTVLRQEGMVEDSENKEIWKITTKPTPHQIITYQDESSSLEQSSDESQVNLHGHIGETEKAQCYECEIERLRKRKQKARLAIKEIDNEEKKRSKMLNQMGLNMELLHESQARSHLSGKRNNNHSYNSIRLN